MARFYKPHVIAVGKTPVIVYPCEGVEQFLRREDSNSTARHLEELYQHYPIGNFGEFNIDILWKDKGALMTDVWMFTQLGSWGSGAFSEARTFKDFRIEKNLGTSAEFGHSILGREAEHRLWTCNGDMERYLKERPELHPGTTNGINFFVGI